MSSRLVALLVIGCSPAKRSEPAASAPDAAQPDAAAARDATANDAIAPSGLSVYAHTTQELYKIDPDTLALTRVGAFDWAPGQQDDMTDLAIDSNGVMVGISFGAVYRVDPATAHVILTSLLPGLFNGLSFVPASALNQTGDDILVGTRSEDGLVYRIDPMTGTSTQIGNMGGTYTSSGDLVAVDGFGIVQTTSGMGGDVVVRLAPPTFTATPLPTNSGFGGMYGLAFWGNRIFGFTYGGDFVTIDPMTGIGTLVQHTTHQWCGAAVATIAPVILTEPQR